MPHFRFALKSPCTHCPFRSDIAPFLRKARVEEIVRAIEHKTFACHETVHTPQQRDRGGRFMPRTHQHCAGALILMHKVERQGDMQQIAERLGLYDRDQLRMDAPVFDSFEQMIEAQE